MFLQLKDALAAEEPFPSVILVKLQPGVVLRVNVLHPAAVGVPDAVNTIVRAPVPAKVPEPEKVMPFTVLVVILYVPAVVTVAVIVCVTPDTAVLTFSNPAVAVEHEYAETIALPLLVGCIMAALVKLQFGVVFNV